MGWVDNATPRLLDLWERPGTQRTGDWVGPKVGLDGCGKFFTPWRLDPRTSQPVASRCTDSAIPAHNTVKYNRV